MDLTELEGLKIRMELWLEQHPTQQPRTFTEDEIKPFLAQDTRKVTDSEPSHPVLHLAARPSSSQEPKSSVYRIDSGNAPQPTPQPPPNPPAPSENEAVLVDDATCDQLFHSLWSKGEPIVWDINQEDLELDWSPRMFIEQYGQQVVEIVDHADEACLVKVAEFFDEFGKERPQGTGKRIKVSCSQSVGSDVTTSVCSCSCSCAGLASVGYVRYGLPGSLPRRNLTLSRLNLTLNPFAR